MPEQRKAEDLNLGTSLLKHGWPTWYILISNNTLLTLFLLPSTQSLFLLPSTQSLFLLPSTQSLFLLPSTQSLIV